MNEIHKTEPAAEHRQQMHGQQVRAAQNGRPVGVMLIAALFFLLAVTVAIGLFFMFRQPGGIAGAFVSEPFAAAFFLLSLPVTVAIGLGLFRLREWGRGLACAFLVVAIIRFFVDALHQYPLNAGLALGFTNSLVPTAILMYLSHPSIRPAFRRNTTR